MIPPLPVEDQELLVQEGQAPLMLTTAERWAPPTLPGDREPGLPDRPPKRDLSSSFFVCFFSHLISRS